MNKEQIIKEVMDWFNQEYPGVHNEVRHSKCARDTGYNYDAIVSDLETGGIAKTIQVANKYWNGTKSQLGPTERPYAVIVNDKLGEVLSKHITEKDKVKLDRLINNINDVLKYGAPQAEVVDLMSKRHNTQFYSDKIPDKEIVDKILQTAHNLTPHKNNFYRYRINVFGPEYKEDKRIIAISSVGGDKNRFREKPQTEEKIQELTEIYDEWVSEENRKKGYPKVKDCNFNTQVLAPYLLVYTHQPDYRSESQKESPYYQSGHMDEIFNERVSNHNAMDWVIQASMHGITTAYLCEEKGLQASFCRCFFLNAKLLINRITDKSNYAFGHYEGTSKQNIAFMLGIGYADEEPRHKSYVPLPKYDEIVNWK